jgi:alkylation response protein AidB-like acyl-CoA dehydrogenase
LLLWPGDRGLAVGTVALEAVVAGADLTRPSARWPEGETVSPIAGQTRPLDADDLARWRSLGLAVACADLVGAMRGALTLATDYARDRRQYGATIGSFQAVQHMLADAHVAMEGSRSIALHAAWAVDALPAHDALAAASAAKAYCARAARDVCETSIQVHGGIGFTFEHPLHRYYKRALELEGALGYGRELRAEIAAYLLYS